MKFALNNITNIKTIKFCDETLLNKLSKVTTLTKYIKDKTKEINSRVEEALDLVGLVGKEDHFSYVLSGGEQQRACLARAIIKEPDVILADEPTGNLDPVAAFELVQLLETINNEGTTILMASHNYNLIKGRGRRIIELKDGLMRGS